jgi:RHS repeat-associated protein
MLTGRADFAPFGEELSPLSLVDTAVFAQLFADSETALFNAQMRMHQPRTGRFIRVDPVTPGLSDPQRWNRYAYALNSPLTYIDPNGAYACATTYCETVTADLTYVPTFWGRGQFQFYDAPLNMTLSGQGSRGGGTQNPVPVPTQSPADSPSTESGPVSASPPASPDDCQQYAKSISGFISSGTKGLWDRLSTTPGRGADLIGMALGTHFNGTQMPVSPSGTVGFQRRLIDYKQGVDVYKHLTFMAGAAVFPSGLSAAFTAYDAVQAPFRRESISELHADLAGWSIRSAVQDWVFTGDTHTLERRVASATCTAGGK